MRALDMHKHEQETMQLIDQLQQLDETRRNYYQDLSMMAFWFTLSLWCLIVLHDQPHSPQKPVK